ncbi:MAG: methylated-DNA--[protein]-cysteine S-methyltransferase [Myxococcales bacterium]|nr:methylated-DNA--[protein]-cysteine S-methyltransferase [Myxococcales bacterium]
MPHPPPDSERWSVAFVDHPVLSLALAVDPEGALVAVDLGGERRALAAHAARHGAALAEAGEEAGEAARRGLQRARAQLGEYLDGARRDFDLELRPLGTDFQTRAWDALRAIPYGATWTYGQQAAYLGDRQATRAVGRANGQNPLPLVIPCHRVIGADGTMTGFGGGIAVKRRLLELEGAAVVGVGVGASAQLSLLSEAGG